MGKVMVMALVAGSLWLSGPAQARQEVTDSGIAAEVRRDVETSLDLWREGRFDELYQRVVPRGRQGKEGFGKKLAAAPRRPACCWEKIQEVAVTVLDPATVTLHARLGFEGSGGTEFVTRSFKVVRMGEWWRLDQSDVFSLAGAGKKRKVYRGKRKRYSATTY